MNGELLNLARDVAVEAGALARKLRSEGVEVADTKSTLTDIVTFADRQTEQLIRDRLAAARPDDGFLGEESGAERGSSGLTWVVDPIDGTVNYAYGLPFYAVSIAVVEGEPDPLTWRALAGYTPRPLTTDTLYLRAREQIDPEDAAAANFWLGLAEGPFALHNLPGNHFTMMEAPHVAAIAAELQRALDRVAPARRSR